MSASRHLCLVSITVLLLMAGAVRALADEDSPHDSPTACPPIPTMVNEYSAVYGFDPTAEAVDVYTPQDTQGEPLIVFVHGGGWVAGDKSNYVEIGKALASCGIAVAIVNYKLAPSVHSDQQAAEVAAALRWLYDRAGSRSFAGNRIFLMGHSAGAQIVAYTIAGGDHVLANAGLTERAIAGIIAIDGLAYDPSTLTPGMALHPFRWYAFANAFGTDPSTWKSFDVSQFLTGQEPPVLIMHGVRDTIAPEQESAKFAQELAKAGDSVTYLQPDRDHFGILRGMTDGPGDTAFEAVVRFVTATS